MPQEQTLAGCLAALSFKPSPNAQRASLPSYQTPKSSHSSTPASELKDGSAQDKMEQKRVQRREAATQWVDKEIRKVSIDWLLLLLV